MSSVWSPPGSLAGVPSGRQAGPLAILPLPWQGAAGWGLRCATHSWILGGELLPQPARCSCLGNAPGQSQPRRQSLFDQPRLTIQHLPFPISQPTSKSGEIFCLSPPTHGES